MWNGLDTEFAQEMLQTAMPLASRFEAILVQRRTKTQKCKGVLFEQHESGWT